MRVDLAPVCACNSETTEHKLVGWNIVNRPVWKCLECGDTRVGPRTFDDAGAGDGAEIVATDGGNA